MSLNASAHSLVWGVSLVLAVVSVILAVDGGESGGRIVWNAGFGVFVFCGLMYWVGRIGDDV